MSISFARRICLGTAVIALLLCGGMAIGADWPMFRHDPNHTGNAGEGIAPPLKQAWSVKLGEQIISSPAVVNGVIYIGCREKALTITSDAPKAVVQRREAGSLNAVDAKTGKLLWKYLGTESEPVGWISSSPAVANGVVYFLTRDGYLYAVDSKGKLKSRFKTGGTDMSSPTVVNGVAYFGSGYPNRDVFAVDVPSMKLKWKFHTAQMIYSSPAVVNGVVYIGSDDGKFYAIDAATGKEKWSFASKGGIFFNSPCVAAGTVFCAAGDWDPGIYALDAATGKLKWQVENDSRENYVSSMLYRDGVAYIVTGKPEQRLYALETATGKTKWRTPIGYTAAECFAGSPVLSGKTLYVGTAAAKQGEPGGGKFLAIDPATGKTKWEQGTDSPLLSSPAVADGMVVVGSLGGTLYAFTGTREAIPTTAATGSSSKKRRGH